jgi:hypothetical protein
VPNDRIGLASQMPATVLADDPLIAEGMAGCVEVARAECDRLVDFVLVTGNVANQ